jgi:sulfonate transport system substrate-binding protein
MRTSSPPTRWILPVILAATFLIAGCSSSASTRVEEPSSSSTTAPEQVRSGAAIPAGTVLRIGDQANYLQTYLALTNEDDNVPYRVNYAAFDGGPPMLQAFQAGAVDIGFVGTTPLIFAQAQGQDLRAVAAWATPRGSYSLVTAPGGHGIQGLSDLRGKRVAYQRGTADEAALRQALDAVGMSADDVTTVDIPQSQLHAALQGGSADAGVSWGPLTGTYLAANPTAKRVAPANAVTDRTYLLIAARSTLSDDAKRAALADYIARLVRSFAFARAHPERVVEDLYVNVFQLTRKAGESLIATTGADRFVVLPGELLHQQQRLADLYAADGQIPKKVDVAGEFDTRFNQLVESVQNG